jgi:nicotinamidase-related amidase
MSSFGFTKTVQFVVGIVGMISTTILQADVLQADDSVFTLSKRHTRIDAHEKLVREFEIAKWQPEQTAVIVCDVWDYHHSINAVRRLEEMLPRLNALLMEARKRGAVIIHAPSDCMPHYEGHPARIRAIDVAKTSLPTDIAAWCSKIPSEELAIYPVDQSDGGEDDDPEEHQHWADKLKSLGRNPGMPWKAQSPSIEVDANQDFISDRGDEVWNILVDRKIKHVIMTGVHTNMCVLGRPFGLRQLVKQKMDVVLVRDLTDSMYNPNRWPFVDHFTGNDLVIAHVEKYVCPTITSDQIVGGQAIQFKADTRPIRDVAALPSQTSPDSKAIHWTIVGVPTESSKSLSSTMQIWLRCAVRFPDGTLEPSATLYTTEPIAGAWLNGKQLKSVKAKGDDAIRYAIAKEDTFGNDDPNVLVLRLDKAFDGRIPTAPKIVAGTRETELKGKWQAAYVSLDSKMDDLALTNLTLPAKFALPPAVFYEFRR